MQSYQSYKLAQSCESLSGGARLDETFEVFDKDQDGYLNAEDLRFVFYCLIPICIVRTSVYQNSSGDEVANMNFFTTISYL